MILEAKFQEMQLIMRIIRINIIHFSILMFEIPLICALKTFWVLVTPLLTFSDMSRATNASFLIEFDQDFSLSLLSQQKYFHCRLVATHVYYILCTKCIVINNSSIGPFYHKNQWIHLFHANRKAFIFYGACALSCLSKKHHWRHSFLSYFYVINPKDGQQM